MTEGTRSNLWVQMREAIHVIHPRLVVWENVRGALSAPASSAMEPCPRCMGSADDRGPSLRALGRVLGDLVDLGYDARWYGLRAADVGGAHGRFRVFLFAQPADADLLGLEGLADQAGAAQAGRHGHAESGPGGPDMTLLPTPVSDNSRGLPSSGTDYQSLPNAVVSLLPTPTTTQRGTDANLDTREGARANLHNEVVNLLPTPAVNDMGAAYTPETWDAWTAKLKADHGNGNGHGKSLAIEAQRLQQWGDYGPAIARWEALTRPAPAPTEVGPKGSPRLSPRFVEWMMGLPEGWVDVEGVSRNEQLKALGNGVVPPQAAAATRAWVADTLAEQGAAS